jgi:adenylosuccinate synthase
MKRAFLVAGLAFGDEGKGATVDFLTAAFDAGLVVRYNGGSQAAHNVVTPDGRWHPFQQFGAGSFHPSVRTHLSRFMLINPMNMVREAEHLVSLRVTDPFPRTTVDEQALIITPYHRELNRILRQPQGINDHTSCGQGIGTCREMHLAFGDRVLFAGDLRNRGITETKLRFIRNAALATLKIRNLRVPELFNGDSLVDHCWNCYRDWPVQIVAPDYLASVQADTVIFEGAQGVLLDETHGEPGFNTWTDTTFRNAETLLCQAGFVGERIRVGVVRSYYTRHGAGPFPTEDAALDFPEPHQDQDGFQGPFRRGHFSLRLFKRALDIVGGVDWLSIGHLDQQEFPVLNEAWPTYGCGDGLIEGHGPTHLDRRLL